MNTLHALRVLRLLSQAMLDRRPKDVLRPVVANFRILPSDVELTRASSHTYMALAALGRWQASFCNVDMRRVWLERWAPLTHSEFIQYKRAVKIFSVVTVTTSVIWWDDKMLWFEHRMTQGPTLCAISYSRGTFYRGKERMQPTVCVVGLPSVPPMDKPRIVTSWDSLTANTPQA
jgi:Thioesterase-like superfamily